MKLICQVTYPYGQMPRIPSKQAKDLDLDSRVYHGGPVQTYEAGQEYDVEPKLAYRLLRDFGPARGRRGQAVKFLPKNPNDYIALLTGSGQAEKVTLGEVIERGFVSPEGGQIEQTLEIEPAGVP